MTPGDQSAALYGGIRPRGPLDRTGEPIDEPAVYPAAPPAVTPEMRAERYYQARQRAERIIAKLTETELEAVEDAIRAARERRGG